MKITTGLAVGATVVALVAVGTGGAVAQSLVTSHDIKDGTVRVKDMRAGAISQFSRPGPAGASGAQGLRGDTGAKGEKGDTGAKGDKGNNGANGLNPAVLVAKDGDAGWSFSGAPAAALSGGELRLAGGFDSNTVSGAIGMVKTFDNVPLSTLTSLRYDMHVTKRPTDVSAPTIHVAVVGASTGTSSGFMNLVFEPVNNGGTTLNQPFVFDAVSGSWWGTRDSQNHPRQATASLVSFVQDNPNAKIIAVSVDNGGSSSNTVPVDAFSAGVDNLVLGFGDSFTRYDFGG